MCLDIREHVGSSEAEWNEEPGAYVFKSQLSQAPSLYNSEDVRRAGISFDSVHFIDALSVPPCVCVSSLHTANNNINNTNLQDHL